MPPSISHIPVMEPLNDRACKKASPRVPFSSFSPFNSKSSMRVLLADDDPFIVRSVQRVLMARGYSNITATENGQSALEKLKGGNFDVAVIDLDFNDSQIDGLSVLVSVRRYNEKHPEAPIKTQIIVMSGSVDINGLEEKLLEAGASMVLHKPVHAISIVAALDMVDESKKVNSPFGTMNHVPMSEPIR